MRMKYVGENPICQLIRDQSDDFIIGEYHPNCCRFPKSCSSEMYEFYPEDAIEQPKKVHIRRVRDVGTGTKFDWLVWGYHPTAARTTTLMKYFPSFAEAQTFVSRRITWEQLLKEEGL